MDTKKDLHKKDLRKLYIHPQVAARRRRKTRPYLDSTSSSSPPAPAADSAIYNHLRHSSIYRSFVLSFYLRSLGRKRPRRPASTFCLALAPLGPPSPRLLFFLPVADADANGGQF